jgi:hypothetical protein
MRCILGDKADAFTTKAATKSANPNSEICNKERFYHKDYPTEEKNDK